MKKSAKKPAKKAAKKVVRKRGRYNDTRKRLIIGYANAGGITAASKEFGVPAKTIFRWLEAWRKEQEPVRAMIEHPNRLIEYPDSLFKTALTETFDPTADTNSTTDSIKALRDEMARLKEDLLINERETERLCEALLGMRSYSGPAIIAQAGSPVPSHTILDTAKSLVYGERQAAYGDVKENFGNIATMWSVILGKQLKADCFVSKTQVGLMLAAMKICRHMVSEKADNLVDIAGYAATLEKMDNETTY